MSPMIASASENRPPAPRPWKARNAASWYIEVARVHSTEPITKSEMASRKNGRRPYRSDSLPYSGVEIVEVIRYAVVAQACTLRPFRSSAMVRMEVETMVWSSAARNIPDIRPPMMIRIWRWLRLPGAATCGAGAVIQFSSGRVSGRRTPKPLGSGSRVSNASLSSRSSLPKVSRSCSLQPARTSPISCSRRSAISA